MQEEVRAEDLKPGEPDPVRTCEGGVTPPPLSVATLASGAQGPMAYSWDYYHLRLKAWLQPACLL